MWTKSRYEKTLAMFLVMGGSKQVFDSWFAEQVTESVCREYGITLTQTPALDE